MDTAQPFAVPGGLQFRLCVVLPGGPPRFGLLFLSGLLVWTLFNTGLGAATSSIVGNGSLVQKVWFPREILPFAAVGASIVSFFFQLIVLLIGLAAFQQWPKWSQIWMLIPAFVAIVLISTGIGLMLGALNVYYRDTGHFLELGLLALFWFTPIVYQYDFLARALREWGGTRAEWIIALNPLVAPIGVFHRVLYNPDNLDPVDKDKYFALLANDDGILGPLMWLSLLAGMILFIAGLRVFARMEANFGKRSSELHRDRGRSRIQTDFAPDRRRHFFP